MSSVTGPSLLRRDTLNAILSLPECLLNLTGPPGSPFCPFCPGRDKPEEKTVVCVRACFVGLFLDYKPFFGHVDSQRKLKQAVSTSIDE